MSLMPVALPPGRLKTGNQTHFYRVRPNDEHNGNCRCSRFGGKRCRSADRSDDDGCSTSNQVCGQRRQGLVAAFSPTILDRYILSVDVSGFVQALVKCRDVLRECRSRCAMKKPDQRLLRLLCARHERPSCTSANQAEKFPPPHSRPSSTMARSDYQMISNAGRLQFGAAQSAHTRDF